MPHISNRKPDKKTVERLDRNLIKFLLDTSSEKRKNIFNEIITPTEKIMVAKRLMLLLFIKRGLSAYEIARTLKMSTSTITRFQVAVESGAFRNSIGWLNTKLAYDNVSDLFSVLSEMVLGKRMSMNQIIKKLT